MEIIIDLEFLSKIGLTINEYLLLYKVRCLKNGLDIPFTGDAKALDSLIDKGYAVKSRADNIVLTSKTNKLFAVKEDKLDELAIQVRELFPKGKKNGQYYWRSNKPELEVKLKAFKKAFKDVTNEQILQATKKYVNNFTDYNRDSGMQLAKYFISKDNMSTLYTEIENLDDHDEEIKSNFESEI
jgi:hypothetical protein